jgi:hypothetical protein
MAAQGDDTRAGEQEIEPRELRAQDGADHLEHDEERAAQ